MTDHNVTKVMAEHRENRSEKYDHRGAGTEEAVHVNPTERSEADKELDAALESGKSDVPFPGDDALGPEDD